MFLLILVSSFVHEDHQGEAAGLTELIFGMYDSSYLTLHFCHLLDIRKPMA